MKLIKELFRDLIDQSWTLLGMAVAWLVLEGLGQRRYGDVDHYNFDCLDGYIQNSN